MFPLGWETCLLYPLLLMHLSTEEDGILAPTKICQDDSTSTNTQQASCSECGNITPPHWQPHEREATSGKPGEAQNLSNCSLDIKPLLDTWQENIFSHSVGGFLSIDSSVFWHSCFKYYHEIQFDWFLLLVLLAAYLRSHCQVKHCEVFILYFLLRFHCFCS